jgi:hypothetical protein
MRIFRTVVVAVLLGAFFSPAVGLAKTEPRVAPTVTEPVSGAAAAPTSSSTSSSNSEGAQYAQREQQSQDAQNFKGGAVYLYFGSGVVLALIIILLLLL